MSAGAAFAATLDGITHSALPGDRVQVKIKLSEPVSGDPLSFTIDNPARIALDLPGTTIALPERTQSIGIGSAQSVTAVEADDRTRVVINLAQLVPYEVSTSGDTISLTLDSLPADLKTATVEEPTMPGAATGASISDIDFRRGPKGEAQVIVDLSAPDVGINITQQGEDVIVDFAETKLPESLDRKLDVGDFATPAREIDTFPHGNGTRMVIKPTGLYEHLAYQSDNVFTLELRELTKAEEEQLKKDKFTFTGERLSLNFQNIEVRAVLQLIADFTEKNLVASDTVGGNVTLRLKNVPWDQALDIILKSRGLGKREIGNVMMIAPQEEIAAREKLELESQQQIQELAPLRTEFMQVNYAAAADIANLIKDESNNLLSERGNVSVDDRTNTLLVQETSDKLAEVRAVVEALDVPVRQVLIESRIVVANEDFSKDLGVRFGFSHSGNVQNRAIDPQSQRSGFISELGGGQPGDITYGGTTTYNTDGNENYIVDLAAAGAAGNFKYAVGRIGSYFLQLELTALQAEGRGEVISSPHVITANQREAVIESGTEIPYLEASSSGATAVSFKKAVLSLKVKPQITPDDRIIMDLSVNRDSVGQVFSGIPSVDTNEVTTQVLVDNGETVVLGGIYESTNRDDKTSVPFFGDLPYLGRLFKRTQNQSNKQELLVFVTPKILNEAVSLSAR
ncbi:MAG: type IV pilus secretin PilQ [Gammaproteobacteria bacterium]|nr:type IV pilus secretin PilQ [Gammaproteobacteria bacterium]MCP5200752.1 type IV pilus secretin PilQ [Gammaproteobacteria bacterium]